MSCLKLYSPAVERVEDACELHPQNVRTILLNRHCSSNEPENVVERARQIYNNRTCRHCRSVAVVPLELADGVRLSRRYSLAGTGTLVGFRCMNCLREWQA